MLVGRGKRRLIRHVLEQIVTRYAELDPGILAALGGESMSSTTAGSAAGFLETALLGLKHAASIVDDPPLLHLLNQVYCEIEAARDVIEAALPQVQ